MRKKERHVYEFGPFRVDVSQRQVTRSGEIVAMQPKVFDTLLVLIESSGQVVEKEDLMRELWPDSFVEESSLSQNIFHLRKALGESGSHRRYIETVPRRGYRFVAEVKKEWSDLEISEGANIGTIRTLGERAATKDQVSSRKPPQRARRRAILASALICSILIISAAIYFLIRNSRETTPFQKIRILRLTKQGDIAQATLSPDGKYVAYVISEGGRQSLWIRQAVSTSNVEIVAPAEVNYRGLTFSRDGNYVYYLTYAKASAMGVIYQVPALGGVSVRVIEDVDSPVTFSPDGRQLAYVRHYPKEREAALMVVDADGSNEKKLIVKRVPEWISPEGPAWSPDGKVIACASRGLDANGVHVRVLAINPADGTEELMSGKRWAYIGQIAWQGDGRGIVAIGVEAEGSVLADQVWRISYPGGEVRRITNDLNGYRSLSLSADGTAMVTIQSLRLSQIFVASADGLNRPTQLTSGFGDYLSDWFGMDWTPDGRIVYSSAASGNPDIWIMNGDGTNPKQLTIDERGDLRPAVTNDGRHIVFVSGRAGVSNIWRMNIDGSDPKQLTFGSGEFTPAVSPDGRWVIYFTEREDGSGVWKVPIEGGDPVRIFEGYLGAPSVSPDGKMIAGFSRDPATLQLKISVIPSDGGPLRAIAGAMNVHPRMLRWTPDSRAVMYAATDQGVSNIWMLPLDGKTARPLTGFQSERLFRFAWSADGKRLAFERGSDISDIVLINSLN